MPYVVKGNKVEYHRTDRDGNVVEIRDEDVFDFIDSRLAFGTGESEYYLTNQGEFIVNGNPYTDDWIADAENYGYSVDEKGEGIDLRNIDQETLEKIKTKFEDAKAEWYEEAGIDETNIHIFEALHEQYEALRKYAKNNADQEAIATIVRTFKEAGNINCLSYLASLKTVEEWAYADDDGLFGSHLCAIMTGFDPGYPKYPNAERKLLLDTYNKEYWHYSEEVNRLVKESGIGER